MRGNVALGIVLERLGDHDGSKVGSADANVDDVGDALAGVSLPLAGADRVGELLHVVEHALDLVRALLLDLERLAALAAKDIAQRDVEHRAPLGRVDVLARKHLVAELFDARLLGERDERAHHFGRDQVLGVVEQDAVRRRGGRGVRPRECLETAGIFEEVLEDEGGSVLALIELLQLLPRGVFCVVRRDP